MFYVLSLIFIWLSPASFAAVSIDQTITNEVESQKAQVRYKWLISEDKFRLAIQSPRGEVVYLFNGKIFYACSKFSDSVLKEVNNFHLVDKDMIRSIKEGSCQVVPLNSMSHFLLTPTGFVSTINFNDGMQNTLELAEYKFATKDTAKIKNQVCNQIERSYVLNKLNSAANVKQKVNEKMCVSSNFSWRPALWKQVSRDLIRQPKSRGFLKTLSEDFKNSSGFVLQSEDIYERDNKKSKRTLVTDEIKENVTIEQKNFQIPAGYTVVDILTAKFLTKQDLEKKELSIEKDPIPAFFYYILGGAL